MNENEQKAGSVADQKSKIRERYKGINPDELDVIPALPQEDIFAVENEQRVAVYARVSTDDPRQTSSYELQKNHYHDVISKSPNWKLVQIYADEGISGTSLQHRDQFKLMIEDCKKGQIDLIVTKSVSRFARNVVDCIGYVRELLALPHPVGVFFETERLNTFDPKSEMVLSFMATLAQEESHTKSEIMNASIEMRFRRGIFLTPILLGYDHDEDGNLIINEGEAKIVKLIFMMYLNGCTCQEIADTLTELGCETKKGNTVWSPGSILQILQNERHCGDVLAHKTYTPNYLNHKSKKNMQNRPQYRKRDHHEAIARVQLAAALRPQQDKKTAEQAAACGRGKQGPQLRLAVDHGDDARQQQEGPDDQQHVAQQGEDHAVIHAFTLRLSRMSSRSSRPVAAVTTTTVSPGSMVSRPPGVMIRPSRLMAPISRFGRVGSSMSGLPQTADFSVARNSSASALLPTIL